MNTPRHRNNALRAPAPGALIQMDPAAELRVFANIYCQTCRVLDFPVSHTALALAIRDAYALGDQAWGLCVEFARFYTDNWTRREEQRTHASVTNGGAA